MLLPIRRNVGEKYMGARALNARRVKISVTVDPALLKEVDRFVSKHPEQDRSKVVNEALFLWYAREEERAIAEQYAAPQSELEKEELAAWHRIQAAAAERIFWGPRKVEEDG